VAGAALAFGGGFVVLLGVNGTFGGVLTASGTRGGQGALGAAAQQVGPGEQKSRDAARSRQAPANGGGTSQTRELQKGEARESAAPPPAAPSATRKGATPGTVEPGVVPGNTEAGDAEVSLPEPDEASDYKADGPSRHTDQQAAEYFRAHWAPDDKAMKRLKDIRTVGGYLRIYTDLPESAGNSSTAITLCKRGLEYLRASGVTNPIVFVQAQFGENGNPVLANILGPSDTSCRVTHPQPN
jgi:hypothetical protein